MDRYFNLYIVRRIVGSKKVGGFLAAFLVFSYAPISMLGFIGIPLEMLTVLMLLRISGLFGIAAFLITLFIRFLPLYLIITLFYQEKKRWAFSLLILMAVAYSPLIMNFDVGMKQTLINLFPLFFLVLYCFFLSIAMQDWELENREELLMKENLSRDISKHLRR